MDYGERLVHLIDAQVAHARAEDGMRTHLGGSIVGRDCMREVWFGWRWADSEKLEGRMLRLFQRGHQEELVFTELLRGLGAQVWTEDAQGKQFRISEWGGHFGGAIDGVAKGLPDLPSGTAVLLEMKTHNDKRFQQLKKKGLREAQPKHFKQSQVYMHKMGLPWCLYCAVNKNDDELWFHLFPYDPAMGQHLMRRAETIIFSKDAPPRIAETPSWFECKFCCMKGVCFGTTMPRVTCRSCAHAAPTRDGKWTCNRNRPEIASSPKQGCPDHIFLPTLFPHLTVEGYNEGENYITFRKRNGEVVHNGPTQVPSHILDLT